MIRLQGGGGGAVGKWRRHWAKILAVLNEPYRYYPFLHTSHNPWQLPKDFCENPEKGGQRRDIYGKHPQIGGELPRKS